MSERLCFEPNCRRTVKKGERYCYLHPTELRQRIKELEARVAELEQQNAELLGPIKRLKA